MPSEDPLWPPPATDPVPAGELRPEATPTETERGLYPGALAGWASPLAPSDAP